MSKVKPLEWEYSRSQLVHWAIGRFYHEYAIYDGRPLGSIHLKEHGYILKADGKQQACAFTVKEMKVLAEALNAKATK